MQVAGTDIYEVEYSEVRAGEMQTFVRRFSTKIEADDFFTSMKRTGTPANAVQKNYDPTCRSELIQ
jgi:hypothetical protein